MNQNYTIWHQPENPPMFQQSHWKPTKKPYLFQSQNQNQNRLKSRRFHPKKKKKMRFFTPFAPRNTTSFIIRAKKSGGIASLVSPCPLTPAILPTPILSPLSEVLVDMAKEEWGVDGYGSMKGLIRLRSPTPQQTDGGSGSSDVDLSRFEMIYIPSNCTSRRVNDEDLQIAMLKEENLTLKERLFLMEKELEDLRNRVNCLENHEEGSDTDLCSENSVGD